VLGGVTYDMSKVNIKKEATIEIFTLMGGVELRVPENVEVRCSTMNILGGVENKTAKPTAKNAPVLNIIGDVVMAGIEIKN
jgi:predicted membrane protein